MIGSLVGLAWFRKGVAYAERPLPRKRTGGPTNLSIEEVARRTGYSDASYFGKASRRRVGSTPTAVRRQHTHLPLSTVLVHGAPRIEEMT